MAVIDLAGVMQDGGSPRPSHVPPNPTRIVVRQYEDLLIRLRVYDANGSPRPVSSSTPVTLVVNRQPGIVPPAIRRLGVLPSSLTPAVVEDPNVMYLIVPNSDPFFVLEQPGQFSYDIRLTDENDKVWVLADLLPWVLTPAAAPPGPPTLPQPVPTTVFGLPTPGAAGTALVSSGSGVDWQTVPYTATTPGNWAGAPPTTAQAAIDRIAALLFTLNGSVPIP